MLKAPLPSLASWSAAPCQFRCCEFRLLYLFFIIEFTMAACALALAAMLFYCPAESESNNPHTNFSVLLQKLLEAQERKRISQHLAMKEKTTEDEEATYPHHFRGSNNMLKLLVTEASTKNSLNV
ncbi:hypothetical protein HHUSO_G19845 [Huso huso]|uniref:Uncharacterized protein n=1 Tax=Huso huso TaxID=61971 RepID=A0ABR0Z2W3_HUSHU